MVEIAAPAPVGSRLDISPDSGVVEVLDAYLATQPNVFREFGDDGLNKDVLRASCLEVIDAVGSGVSQRSIGHLEVLEVEAKNFLSYGTLGPLSLDNRGIVLLDGLNQDDDDAESNGAGKSAVIEAVVFGVFGETLRGCGVS